MHTCKEAVLFSKSWLSSGAFVQSQLHCQGEQRDYHWHGVADEDVSVVTYRTVIWAGKNHSGHLS